MVKAKNIYMLSILLPIFRDFTHAKQQRLTDQVTHQLRVRLILCSLFISVLPVSRKHKVYLKPIDRLTGRQKRVTLMSNILVRQD